MLYRRLLLPVSAIAVLGASACTWDALFGPRADRAPDEGLVAGSAANTWTLVLTDTAGRVWIAQTNAGPPPVTVTAGEWAGPAALWSRLDSAPAARDLTLRTSIRVEPNRSGTGGPVFVRLQWDLGGLAAGGGRLVVDRRHRVWRSRGRAVGELGGTREQLRFDLISGTPMPADAVTDPEARGSVVVRTPAIVSLRIDDCMAADAVAFRLLQALRLTAAMGVPSRRIDRRGHCSQGLLEAMVAAGDAVESHSRLHGPAPARFGDFYLETVGSAQDLRRRGFNPHVFIPPGTWRTGPTLMDSPSKLTGPYAELLHREYVSTQSYALPTAVPIPVTGRDGPSTWPLQAFTVASLEERLRGAAADSQWISFMWHAWDLPPAELEARLRVIAALRDSGLVTVLPYYTALHATRDDQQ